MKFTFKYSFLNKVFLRMSNHVKSSYSFTTPVLREKLERDCWGWLGTSVWFSLVVVSQVLGEKVNKTNLQKLLEQRLQQLHQMTVSGSPKASALIKCKCTFIGWS